MDGELIAKPCARSDDRSDRDAVNNETESKRREHPVERTIQPKECPTPANGDKDTIPVIEPLKGDSDLEVVDAATKALSALKGK